MRIHQILSSYGAAGDFSQDRDSSIGRPYGCRLSRETSYRSESFGDGTEDTSARCACEMQLDAASQREWMSPRNQGVQPCLVVLWKLTRGLEGSRSGSTIAGMGCLFLTCTQITSSCCVFVFSNRWLRWRVAAVCLFGLSICSAPRDESVGGTDHSQPGSPNWQGLCRCHAHTRTAIRDQVALQGFPSCLRHPDGPRFRLNEGLLAPGTSLSRAWRLTRRYKTAKLPSPDRRNHHF